MNKSSNLALLFGLLLGIPVGGLLEQQLNKDVVKQKQQLSKMQQTAACIIGVTETLEFALLRTRETPADCDFTKRNINQAVKELK